MPVFTCSPMCRFPGFCFCFPCFLFLQVQSTIFEKISLRRGLLLLSCCLLLCAVYLSFFFSSGHIVVLDVLDFYRCRDRVLINFEKKQKKTPLHSPNKPWLLYSPSSPPPPQNKIQTRDREDTCSNCLVLHILCAAFWRVLLLLIVVKMSRRVWPPLPSFFRIARQAFWFCSRFLFTRFPFFFAADLQHNIVRHLLPATNVSAP